MYASSSPEYRLTRRATAAGIIFAAIIIGCSGCNGVGSGGTGPTQPPAEIISTPSATGGTVVQATVARDTNPQVPDGDLAAVVAGNTAFAMKAFPALNATSDSNTAFSPYSITMASALLAPGSAGATLSGIQQALSFTLPEDRLNPAFNKLDQLIAGKTTGGLLSDGRQSPQLNNANAVWGQQGFSIIPDYLKTLAVNYGAGLHLVDFINAPEDSRQIINSWVAGQTNNKIVNLLDPQSIRVDTRLVLTNAIWFKSSWASQFPPEATANKAFIRRDGSSSTATFMSQRFTVPYVQTDGCQAIDLPYVGNNLSMLVIMPDPGTFDGFLTSLTPTVLGEITGKLAAKDIAFSMPKFSFASSTDLSNMLQFLGMSDAFHPGRADFSGIDGKRDLFVSDALHQAVISVDEKGSEASAATAIIIGTTGYPVGPALTLAIDHPFVFLIRDQQTGLILFMGKVLDPAVN